MKKIRKSIAFVLFMVMMLSVLCSAPFDVFAATDHPVGSATDLQTACAAINADGGEHTISLSADISGAQIEITNGSAVVTVIGNGHTLTNEKNSVCVANGATVNLGDGSSELTLQGSNECDNPSLTNDDPGAIYVLDGGICNIYNKVTVRNHKGSNYFGGGVTVEGGIFHMYGGTIENCGIEGGSVCYGGGVAVIAGGQFIMDGGTISECYAITDYIDTDYPNCTSGVGGGVFVTSGSTFTMKGGTITNCSATNFGGGVAMTLDDTEYYTVNTSNGVEKKVDLGNPKSKVVINGGTISNNTAKSGAGVFVSGYYYSFCNAIAHLNPDPGTVSNPGLYIDGGASKNVEISSNTATEMGGGVLTVGLRDTRKAQIHNARITNNKAQSGAGIENYFYWTQLGIDGCTISGNEATANGGGIAASLNSGDGQPGYTKIKDTTITGNTSGDRGAGVYYDAESEIRLSGADVIQNNTFNGKKNNLNVLSLEKPVKVVGDLTGSQIGLSDPTLWDDNKEDTAADAVSTARLTDGFQANNASLIPANAFTSDHESWYVDIGEKETQDVDNIISYTYTADFYKSNRDVSTGYPVVDNYFYTWDGVTFNNGILNNVSDIYDEFVAHFTAEYGEPDANGFFYDSKSHYYIYLSDGGNVVYAYIGYDPDSISYNWDYLLYAGVSHQNKYALDGKVAAQIYRFSYDSTSTTYDTVKTDTKTFTVKNKIDFNGETTELYEKNDLGIPTGKLIVYKDSETVHKETSTDVLFDYTSEVRLVRRTAPIKFHDNKDKVNKGEDKLFRVYNGDAKDAEDTTEYTFTNGTVEAFYDIPAFAEDDYVFAGWYYNADGDKDGDIPFEFDAEIPANLTDVYAHWIPVGEVEQQKNPDAPKDKKTNDFKELPAGMNGKYKGFELFGVQIRPELHFDNNQGDYTPGGLRFIASISEELLTKVDALSDKTTNGNKVEYGFVTAAESTVETVVNNTVFTVDKSTYKLQYRGANVNGVDTLLASATPDERKTPNNFRYITNVDCTSEVGGYGSNPRIQRDHKNFTNYRLATFVVTYNDDETGENKGKNIAARAYMRYYDGNGLLRTFYNDYAGTNFYGGCSTKYNDLEAAFEANRNTVN